jgi:glutamate dehydrogenase
MDYVSVRRLDDAGRTIGEARLLGLFTSKAYMEQSALTPILRRKLADIVAAEDLIEGSHDHKALVSLFEGFSKHDLFASPTDELHRTLTGMLAHQEQGVKLYARRDLLQRNVSLLVTMPRDRFNSAVRLQLQDLFRDRLGGTSVDYHLALGEADPAQLHFTVWTGASVPEIDYRALEREVRTITRSWSEQVVEALAAVLHPEEAARLVADWSPRFPDYYVTATGFGVAAGDICRLAELSASGRPFTVGIQNEDEVPGQDRLTRIALYRRDGKRPLSELVPALEDLGLHVVEETATRLKHPPGYFVHDFGVLGPEGTLLDLESIAPLVSRALESIWSGEAESDNLNRLIVSAGLRHEQVAVLRSYRTYWRRVSPVFTVAYVNDTLVEHADIAADLVRLFELTFDPDTPRSDTGELTAEILDRLDAVPSIEQDRILRTFLLLIQATLRTNAFVPDRRCLSFKFRSSLVPDAPLPHPMAEVFVYGPDVEGIHLRGGMVARGGIRWSTRREDYRTEVLGLMKAQMTKNALIVPTGAKGGFVLRAQPEDPDLLPSEVERCYRLFIGALLDVTDNMEGGTVIRPPRVVARDGDDPYLVVAADKGTAAFSDVANEIAAERAFWLGDAFASGGSSGYDHKALGITARGAWESLKRHFADMGIDPGAGTFTVVGIGDMSGDVFGNGMLLSDRIRLVAAFDHRDVFIDPDPDPVSSYAERARLFAAPRSSWSDYDGGLISPGGGVYSRASKRIELSPEARRALGTEASSVTPAELVAIVLRAPVDLIWNGGIGTYVKASGESDAEAGDRANDAVRVDATEVRARIVVEGGNLGLTQRGRIEYAAGGGRIFTDFIDNSAGVNCSDREVNLKILLGIASERGELDRAERNALIARAAPDVVDRILRAGALQARILSIEETVSPSRLDSYGELMTDLESAALLDRNLEALPDPDEFAARTRSGGGLTRPELAVLLAYEKRRLTEIVARSELGDDPHVVADLREYFPAEIAARFDRLICDHPLRRRLTATLVANDVVDMHGVVFVSRIALRAGADPADVVAAYRIARDVTGAPGRWHEIDALSAEVDRPTWMSLVERIDRLVTRVTRWYLGHPSPAGMGERVAAGRRGFVDLETAALDCGSRRWRAVRQRIFDDLTGRGVPGPVACFQAAAPILASGPDLMEVAAATGRSHRELLDVAVHAGEAFGIDRLGDRAADAPAQSRWDRWALWTIEEDLLALRRLATERVLAFAPGGEGAGAVRSFMDEHPEIAARLSTLLEAVEHSDGDIAALTVAVGQIRAALS